MSEPTGDRERRVDGAIAWYYRQAEAGSPPDPAAFLTLFADVHSELQSFLADKAAFDRVAVPVDPDATVTVDAGGAAARPAPMGRVRYFGDYELINEIARGGMGVVYRARQVSLNRVVALKMILSGQLASEADVKRFRQEAEAAANLDHPNILPIYEVGEHDGNQYFSMKLVEGGSLAQSPRTYVRGQVELFTKVSRAVHFAHQRGLLHRDLKPANILLDPDGTPYVTDFGLAKKVESDAGLTQSGALVGTPSYMAPEQARAERQLTTGVDVYSLGAILYELLTGQPPFRGTGVMDTVLQVLERDAMDPRKINPRVDRDLSVIALKCLAKEPAKRYESAAALADDLERWQRGEPIVARPAGPRERLVKWVRRNPVPAAFTAIILILLVSGLTAVTRLYLRSERFRQDAENERDQARGRLARQFAEKAGASADQANPLLGLPWLVEAVKTTEGTPAAELHRLHLSLLLKTAPGLVHYSPTASCIAMHPDGQRIALGEKEGVELLAVGGDQRLVPLMKLTGPPSNVEFNPDGKRLLVAGGVGGPGLGPWQVTGVRIFDVDTGEPLTPETNVGREKDGATSVRFSADGTVVVALWQGHVNRHVVNMEVYLYDAATMKAIGKPFIWGHPEGLDYVQVDYRNLRALVPCRNVEATSFDFSGLVQMWDLRSGKPLFDPLKPEEGTPIGSFSPTGEFFALQQGEKTVRLYHAATGKPARAAFVHPDRVASIAYRPDGKEIATFCKDGKIRKWDVLTGAAVTPEIAVNDVDAWYSLIYSSDGRTIALVGTKGAIGFDAMTGTAQLTADNKDAVHGYPVLFSPDGVHALTTNYEGVFVWGRNEVLALPFLPHGGAVQSQFSPNGRYLLTSGNGIRVWDLAATGRPAVPFLDPPAVAVLSTSLNTRVSHVVSLDMDGTVRVFDAANGQPIGPGFRPPGEWQTVDLSPDGKVVITVGWAERRPSPPTVAELKGRICAEANYIWKAPRDVGVWDAASGQAIVSPLRHRSIARVLFGNNGKSLLVSGRVLDYTGKEPFAPSDDVTDLVCWDLETGDTHVPVVRQPGSMDPLTVTPDGKRFLALVPAGKRKDGTDAVAVQFWQFDALMPEGLLIGPTNEKVTQAALSSDGRRILTVSADGDAQVWDAATGGTIAGPFRHTTQRVGQKAPLAVAIFSPDGRWVLTATDTSFAASGEFRVWDVETGRPVTPVVRDAARIAQAVFSPDGRLVLTTGSGRATGQMRLWEAETGMPVSPPLAIPLRGRGEVVPKLRDEAPRPRFTADGHRILVASDDGFTVLDLLVHSQLAAGVESLAQILSGHEVDAAGGFQALSDTAATMARERWLSAHSAPRVTSEHSKSWPAYRARLAVEQKSWETAILLLSELTKADSGNAWAAFERANALEKLHRLEEALASWDAMVRVADGPTVRSRRGTLLAILGKFPEAATDFSANWSARGRPQDGARLALAQWAAGDRGGYRRTCEQLRDRRNEFVRSSEGLILAGLACGLDPDSADLIGPFIPLLEGIGTAEFGDTELLRPLALAYVRTGMSDKVVPLMSGWNATSDYYSRHWAIQLLIRPNAGGPLGLSGILRGLMAKAVNSWYERTHQTLDWSDRIMLPELRKQGR